MKFSLSCLIASLILMSGCAKEIKPWEKEALAKKTMKESGPTPLLKKYEEHIYYSKEASKGGAGISGGGCGCN